MSEFEFDGNFETYLGNGTVKRNSNFSESVAHEFSLCLKPSTTTPRTDAMIEYGDANFSFVTRNYYFQQATLSSTRQDIHLYSLDAEDSTSFIQVVRDQKLSPVVGALVLTQRYYPGEGIYRTIQISKTDDNGESIGFYETEVPDYKHIITLDGTLLLETSAQKVVGKEVPYTLTFTVGDALAYPWSYWEENPNIQTTLSWNKTSEIVTFSYIDVTGSTTYGRLWVTKESNSNSSVDTICSQTSTQSSATLTCNMSGYSGSYVARGIIEVDTNVAKLIRFVISTAKEIFGNTGLLVGFFIILTASMAFIWNPSAGVIMVNAALWFTNIMGFISFSYIFLFAIGGVSVVTILLLKT